MTTSIFLNSILNILPAMQARQLTDLMNDLKNTGAVRNIDEYRNKLQELSALINSVNPKPSFQQIRGLVWYLISSDAHNYMMRATKNDIDALFLQLNEIGEKLQDHHYLVMNNIISDIEKSLQEKELIIKKLEWLSSNTNEWTLAQSNTFSSTSLLRTARSELGKESLFYDNRTHKIVNVSEISDCQVSSEGKKLILGTKTDSVILPVDVKFNTSDSSYPTQVQTSSKNNISNIIDGTLNTYWARNVILSKPTNYVSTILTFDLGQSKDINYLVIEGAASLPFSIDKIDGILFGDGRVNILSDSILVNGSTRIDFVRNAFKEIEITFTVKSYMNTEMYSQLSLLPEEINNQNINEIAADVVSNVDLKELLNLESYKVQIQDGYLYSFALDNVWFGNSIYEDVGLFVSKPLKVSNIGRCAVDAVETIQFNNNVGNSIEYEIIKRDTFPSIKETFFSIPALNQSNVVSERLILNKQIDYATQYDVGNLRFYPYIASGSPEDMNDSIRIYENGNLLVIQQDYAVSVDCLSWYTSLVNIPEPTIYPQRFFIKLFKPKFSSVYTADYEIKTSDINYGGIEIWLDKDKTVKLVEDGKVDFPRTDTNVKIESELYLQVSLRKNIYNSSPELNEYTLLAATYTG